jgi:hypothetical protein
MKGAVCGPHTAGLFIASSVWSFRQRYLLRVQRGIIAEVLGARGITIQTRKRDILAGIAISGVSLGIGTGVAEVSSKSTTSDTKS